MSSDSHETLVYRLAQILVKLNQGERLDPRALAEEFGVNLRTIQRDLNLRFAYLPLQKSDGRYHLDAAFLGKLSTKDIERFASLAGVSGLFPSLNDEFLRDIFDQRLQDAFLIRGHHYEDMSGKDQVFRLFETAIVEDTHVSFDYRKAAGIKSYPLISPYKLINLKGIWYLAGVDGDKLKTFSLSKISAPRLLDTHFLHSDEIGSRLATEEGIWFSEQQHDVLLKVESDVAGYFKRRKLIANQVIEEELANGDLLISAVVGHPNQILPIVRYWIPSIRVIRPASWQIVLENSLTDYLRTKAKLDSLPKADK